MTSAHGRRHRAAPWLWAALALELAMGTIPATAVADEVDAAAIIKQITSRNDVVSPLPPTDIHGGAANTDLQGAAFFAWQEFIALNWPAAQSNGVVQRDVPDEKAVFGQPGAGPLVWQTYRQKVEIFPGANALTAPPHGYQAHGVDYGYNDPPKYQYKETIAACPGEPPVGQTPWVNLDETSQIELDTMYAGILRDEAPSTKNSAPQLIRFLAKANKTEYDYVAANKFWYSGTGTPLQAQIDTWTTALAHKKVPAPGTVPALPTGTFEVKSAWRPLAKGEDRNRFHMATVRYYEKVRFGTSAVAVPCYRQDEWALVALHIIQKTPSAPYFVFATFEQADNILTADGKPLENDNGVAINLPGQPPSPTQPALTYTDDPQTPKVTAVPAEFCNDTGSRLYFRELPPAPASPSSPVRPPAPGTPVGGNICVNNRYERIPSIIATINQAVHASIKLYNDDHQLKDSPWLHYKLVNVQAVPFNKKDIVPTFSSTRQVGNFFQANIVVETDYTLQQFVARIADNQAPTAYPKGGTQPDFQNVYVAGPHGFTTYQMGGCMGCHGNAQVGGTDFSFILGGNRFNSEPDTPDPTNAALKRSYFHELFDHAAVAK
ncbi:hypothetical protein FBZ89_102132 [Nitrospirillum amazonense]|uniref:Cytochrome c domain-containing protein n=1 Tax=Nitrospirillum amazonense TaxID=28077 RepID=A0A560FP35_9PROT|nr:hypothetical protein [Nitrospirillum amazonense]TWB23379.1 hypothetical protein FBZ89_102132 [Nitrospirillum amazonense]